VQIAEKNLLMIVEKTSFLKKGKKISTGVSFFKQGYKEDKNI
jgi:hypothetical protein